MTWREMKTAIDRILEDRGIKDDVEVWGIQSRLKICQDDTVRVWEDSRVAAIVIEVP